MATYTCQHCGQSFERIQSPAHERRNPPKYCCHPCALEASRATRVQLTCAQCGQEFHRKKYMADWSQERGPFCSFACYGQWQSEHAVGPGNPNYQADTHLVVTCDWCGQEFERKRSYRGGRLKFCSGGCYSEYRSEHFVGSGNPAWRGGNYWCYHPNWQTARKHILERDHSTCQQCGATEQLVVHHVIPYVRFENPQDAHAPGNLVTLCRTCHRRLHNQMRLEQS